MSSIGEQIVVAAVSALNAGSPPCVFDRERIADLVDADLPRGVVYPLRESPASPFLERKPVVRPSLTIVLELRALGTSSLRPSQAVDPLYVWAVSKLAGNTLGGLVHELLEGERNWQYGVGDKPICLLTMEMVATYQHLTADAEVVK